MNQKSFEKIINKVIDKVVDTLLKKGKGYNDGRDVLSAFKRSAEIDNIHPIRACRGMDLKHRQSIDTILNNVELSIPIDEKVLYEKYVDHINYCLLEIALIIESNKELKGL